MAQTRAKEPKGTTVLIVLRGYPVYHCPHCANQVHSFLVAARRR